MRAGCSIWMVLFLMLLGCAPQEEVEVSGAVANPGPVGFRPVWAPMDYVRAAGGVSAEAVLADAMLVRAVMDSTQDGVVQSVRFALNDSVRVLPGDVIRVPARAYAVRLDTARLVQDAVLSFDGQIFKIPHGVVVPGWTDRGVMTALLLGRGRVFEESDTSQAVSAFHYLYVHLHPGEYDRLRGFVGAPYDSLEALEDAHAIHSFVREGLAYQQAGEMELPPEGYWRVLQGIFLTPKTATTPGKGMRKRRYDDGRIWTTFRDGRQRWQFPDGRVEMTFPGGSTEVRYRDGRVVYTDIQGTVRTLYADGREEWALTSGVHVIHFPDGRLMRSSPNGDTFQRERDGTERTEFANGDVHIRYPDGRLVMTEKNGRREERFPDGHREVVTAEGHAITLYPDGHQVTRLADGGEIRYGADGQMDQTHASGIVTQVAPDGTRRDVYPDGTIRVTTPDEVRVVRYVQGDVLRIYPSGRQVLTTRDGGTQERFPDGHVLHRFSSGSWVTVFPDGRRLEGSPHGHEIQSFPDGRKVFTMPGIYAYPGAFQTGLAQVDELPDTVAIGDELVVTGRTLGAVEGVYVAAFQVPDGDVVDGDVRRQGERFHARFKFKEAGNYRVQVQIYMPRARMYTVAHQAVRVGKAEDPARETFAISAYPGNEAAEQFLIDQINTSRRKISRRPLMSDPELMSVARIRLEEMLAMGEVSHLSASGRDVMWHVSRRRLFFVRVGENVGRGHYLEALHPHWMLSAGHRKNILAPYWTHVGVAVTESEGSVWGVEVFGQR